MAAPGTLTVIKPVQIQTTSTTTPNGVATSVVVMGDDDNLYLLSIQNPGINASQVSVQPWIRLPPIGLVTADGVDYPYPTDAAGNVINQPYNNFKIQGA